MCAYDDVRGRRIDLLGQVALLVFFLLDLPARHYPAFHPDLMDAVRGMFLGVGLGTMLLTVWRRDRRAA